MYSLCTNRLPAETTIVIFQYCTQLVQMGLANSCMTRLSRQLTSLRLVCVEWNTIITQTPSFWTEICIQSPESPPVATLSLWLNRSGSSPLHINLLRLDNVYPRTHERGIPEVLDILCHSLFRWTAASIYVADDAAHLLNHFPFSFAHSLQKLSFETVSEKETLEIVKCAGNIPNLRSFSITIPSPLVACTMSRYMSKALNGLTHVDLAFSSGWNDAWKICQQCTSAIDINLELRTSISDDFHSPPIDFPNLMILNLDTQPWMQLTTLIPLTSFRAPNLRVLSLSTTPAPSFSLVERLSEYIADGAHSLHLLRVQNIDDADDVKKLFHGPRFHKIPVVEVISKGDQEELKALIQTWGDGVGREVTVAMDVYSPELPVIGWNDPLVTPPAALNDYFSNTTTKPINVGLVSPRL